MQGHERFNHPTLTDAQILGAVRRLQRELETNADALAALLAEPLTPDGDEGMDPNDPYPGAEWSDA